MSSNPYDELIPHEDADEPAPEQVPEPTPQATQGRGGLFSPATDLRVSVRKNEYVVTSKAVEDSEPRIRTGPTDLFDDGSGAETEGGR